MKKTIEKENFNAKKTIQKSIKKPINTVKTPVKTRNAAQSNKNTKIKNTVSNVESLPVTIENDCVNVLTIPGIKYKDVYNEHFMTNTSQLFKKPIRIDSKFLNGDNDNDDVDIYHETGEQSNKILYFFDSKKTKIKAWPVMVDVTNCGPLPLYTRKPCRNCHKQYDTHPIGCPLKYIPHINIDKDFDIESLDPKKKAVLLFLKKNNFSTERNDYFETENLFCRYTCVKSYILECLSITRGAQKYKNALSNLTIMYRKLHGITTNILTAIPAAQDIELMEDYGGHLTIDELREADGILIYNETINIKRPLMYSISTYYEELKL